MKTPLYLLQNQAGFPRFGRSEEDTCAWYQGDHGVRGLFAAVFWRGEKLDLPHPFVSLAKFEAGKPGGESESASLCSDALPEFSGIKLKAGMRLRYMGSKAWLAPHMDRLLGDVAVLHSPFFSSGKLEYYLAARRPGLLEARPGLPALLAAPGGAQGGQALLLRAPPAGRAERPCRAPGCLRRTSCCATASRESGAPSHSRGHWH